MTAIRDNFTSVSYSTGDPPGTPNNTWGYGKLDVEAGVAAAAGFARVSVLTVLVQAAPAPATVRTERGLLLPLQQLTLTAQGPEAVNVTQLGLDVSGTDPEARLLIVQDTDGDGIPDPGEPVLGSARAVLQGDTTRVVVPIALQIPAGGTVRLIAALEMSGAAPEGAIFQSWFVPEETRAVGVVSGLPSPLRQPTDLIQSPAVRGTVLAEGELYALSANPVRSQRLIVSFRSRPEMAAIYTVSGRRVVDLLPRMEDDLRLVWDLTNESGARIADGVYFAIFRIEDETVREKLIIARPAGAN
jgi:hypothetical protein